MSTSPFLILSRGNVSSCTNTKVDRCLLNEAELIQVLVAMHDAILASDWHAEQTPHPLELQPGQHVPVQV